MAEQLDPNDLVTPGLNTNGPPSMVRSFLAGTIIGAYTSATEALGSYTG